MPKAEGALARWVRDRGLALLLLALFENWESEFLQMAVFVLLTTFLIQKGSPESRRSGVTEQVDADPVTLRTNRGRPGRFVEAAGFCGSMSIRSDSRSKPVHAPHVDTGH